MINEAFDKETTDQAIKLIKQMNAIKWPTQLQSFKSITEQAISELQKIFVGGDRQKNIFSKIVDLFKGDEANPFVDAIAYASAIHSFFTTINKYVEANNPKNMGTVGDVLGGNKKLLQQIVKKGLKPEGMISTISTNSLYIFIYTLSPIFINFF